MNTVLQISSDLMVLKKVSTTALSLHRLHCFCLEFDGACEVPASSADGLDYRTRRAMYPAMAVSAWLLDMNTVLDVSG